MAPSSSILFCLAISLLSLGQSQNTNFSINFFSPNSQKVIYERDAIVPPDEPFVRLTAGSSSVGRVLYKAPVKLWDTGKQASFETTITLQITPIPSISYGEGMTFFIVPVNSTVSTGGASDNLGIYDAVVPGSPVFAVEFDISSNQGSLDPRYPHIGINVNTQRSQNTTKVEEGIIGELVTARITYDVPTRKINVVAAYGSTTHTVSSVLNLAGFLPQQVQLGLSASTSSLAAYFDAYTWHFNSTMVPDLTSVTTKPYVM